MGFIAYFARGESLPSQDRTRVDFLSGAASRGETTNFFGRGPQGPVTGWLSLTEHSTHTFRALAFHLHLGPLAAEVRCAQGQVTLVTGPRHAGEMSRGEYRSLR